jgi:hypothetical protein
VATEDLASSLLSLLRQHSRLMAMATEGRVSKPRRVEGLTQVGRMMRGVCPEMSCVTSHGDTSRFPALLPIPSPPPRTQAVGGKRGRGAASSMALPQRPGAPASSSHIPTVYTRIPTFSVPCLARLLDAIVDDGFVTGVPAAPGVGLPSQVRRVRLVN